MFLFDPARGRARRARLRDKLVRAEHELEGRGKVAVHDLSNRAHGIAHDLSQMARRESTVDDDIIVARVRARLGRAIPHPGGIEVHGEGRVITLRGPVLRSEHDALLRNLRYVRGVRELRDELTLHDEPGNVPALQGERHYRRVHVAPSTKLIAALGVGALLRGL
jgi:hypothetical protein